MTDWSPKELKQGFRDKRPYWWQQKKHKERLEIKESIPPNFRRVRFDCCFNCEHCPTGECDLHGKDDIGNPYDWVCDDYMRYKQ